MRCDECRFFNLGPSSKRGECRRNPPASSQGNLYGHWPIVDTHEWCGEFEITNEAFEAAIKKQLED